MGMNETNLSWNQWIKDQTILKNLYAVALKKAVLLRATSLAFDLKVTDGNDSGNVGSFVLKLIDRTSSPPTNILLASLTWLGNEGKLESFPHPFPLSDELQNQLVVLLAFAVELISCTSLLQSVDLPIKVGGLDSQQVPS